MFDLEKAIAAWRHPFQHHRAFQPDDIDEMERHLRDQVQDLVEAGRTEEEAFHQAAREMGGLPKAEAEYRKVHWKKVRHRGAVRHEVQMLGAMFGNYVKLAYRTLLRNKLASTINVVGLSIALACCVGVYLFLVSWYSMDSYHTNGDRIFLAQHDVERNHQVETWGRAPMPLGPAMTADFPQVERTVRVNWHGATVQHGDRAFDELITFVDVGFFDMLTFPLKHGTPEALADPNVVILSDRTATKYFGAQNPVGETLALTFGHQHRVVVTVGGITEAFPSNTGFRFGFLMRFDQQRRLGLADLDDWGTLTSGLLVQVKEPGDIETITAQMERYVPVQNAAAPDWPIQSFSFDSFTDPASDAHLVRGRIAEAAHPALSIIFIAIALFMLALSCFNYINIALGAAARRLKEIGMRKVIGGNKRQLVIQFMTENILLCLLALVVGILLAKVFLIPLFNSIFILQLDLSLAANLGLWAFLVALLVGVGVLSGAYPALYVASFQPIAIFRGRQKLADQAWFTKAFLTFQFVLAFITVILSVVLMMNSRYLIRQDWGYDPAHRLIVELQEQSQYPLLRDALAQHPDVVHLAGTANHIGRSSSRTVQGEPGSGQTQILMQYAVGPNYLQTMGLRLQSGRLFDVERSSDRDEAVVVNEQFVQSQGWKQALGQTVRLDSTAHTVVGVVEDFRFFLLARPQPAVFRAVSDSAYAYLALHVREGASEQVEAFVEATWDRLFPGTALTQFHQENVFNQTYQQYNDVVQAFSYIAALALLIACMGLFGLASQNLARRMKEVSIRKVVGATVPHLAFLANRRFLGLLVLAAAIATTLCVVGLNLLLSAVRASLPVAHMPLSPWPFLVAYALVFATAAVAVSGQAYKLVRVNPAEVLRRN